MHVLAPHVEQPGEGLGLGDGHDILDAQNLVAVGLGQTPHVVRVVAASLCAV